MNEFVSTGAKVSGTFFTPFGRINLYITLAVLSFLVIYGSFQSVQQKSIYPLLDAVIFKTVGADHKISESLDSLDPILVSDHKPLSSEWFSYWWAMFLLWFGVLVSLWFIFIVLFALYKLFEGLNNTNPLMNVGYAVVLFAILQVVVGLALYPTLMAGKVMSNDKVAILNDAFSHSYPFEGVVKLVSRIVSGGLFDKAYAWLNTPQGQLVSNVPTSYINSSGGV